MQRKISSQAVVCAAIQTLKFYTVVKKNTSQKNYNSFHTKHVSASLLPSSVVNYKAIGSKIYVYLKCQLHGVMELLQK